MFDETGDAAVTHQCVSSARSDSLSGSASGRRSVRGRATHRRREVERAEVGTGWPPCRPSCQHQRQSRGTERRCRKAAVVRCPERTGHVIKLRRESWDDQGGARFPYHHQEGKAKEGVQQQGDELRRDRAERKRLLPSTACGDVGRVARLSARRCTEARRVKVWGAPDATPKKECR